MVLPPKNVNLSLKLSWDLFLGLVMSESERRNEGGPFEWEFIMDAERSEVTVQTPGMDRTRAVVIFCGQSPC